MQYRGITTRRTADTSMGSTKMMEKQMAQVRNTKTEVPTALRMLPYVRSSSSAVSDVSSRSMPNTAAPI